MSPLDKRAVARAVTQCPQVITAPFFISTASFFRMFLSWEGTVSPTQGFIAMSALISKTAC